MKEIFKFPDVLESIKMSVFIFQHKNILVKENIYLADDRKRMKLEVVNWYLFCLSWLEVILKLSWLYYAYGAHLLNDKNLLTIYIYIFPGLFWPMAVFKRIYLKLWRLQIEYDVKYIFSKWWFLSSIVT